MVEPTTKRVVPGRVSVVTATYNAAATLRTCVESVLAQEYRDVEYVVVDGGSTDGTTAILQSYDGRIARWISEPDSGIYDAWNKGIAMATGEWIAFLGADDQYLPGALQAYMDALQGTDAEFVCSQVLWAPAAEKSKVIGRAWRWPAFQHEMRPAHVGSLHRHLLFEKYGLYDTSYRIVGDYELLLRAGPALKALYVPVLTVKMAAGGTSDSFAALKEAERAKVKSGKRPAALARIELWIKQAKLATRRLQARFRPFEESR